MLSDQFYIQLATSLKSEPRVWGSLFMAIGSGQDEWDRLPPDYNRSTTQLVEELMQKPVSPNEINYLDDADRPTGRPSPKLLISTRFDAGEGEGTVRECGLYVRDRETETTSLLVYFIHRRIEKGPNVALQRQIRLDLRPHSGSSGNIETRYLGNVNSQELHDLDNEQPGCQIEEIRFDRRFYFASPEQAISLNYDYCAYCFGRELSQR